MKINIMTATGQLGRIVIQALFEQGAKAEDLIASVRTPSKAKNLEEQGVSICRADYNDPESMKNAFQATDILLLIPSLAMVEERIMQHFHALEAAKAAGVKRIVFASFAAAQPTSKFYVAPFMLYAESKLKQSGMDWTILRNGMYLDPVTDWVPDLVEMGRLPYPVKKGRVAYISRYDIARSLAAAILNNGHSKKVYEITGSKAVSMSELAAAISSVTNRSIKFSPVTDEEYAEVCRKDNIPEPFIQLLISLYWAVDNREFELVTDNVEKLTGIPPEDIEDFMRRTIKIE